MEGKIELWRVHNQMYVTAWTCNECGNHYFFEHNPYADAEDDNVAHIASIVCGAPEKCKNGDTEGNKL